MTATPAVALCSPARSPSTTGRLGISTRYYRVSRLLDELALADGSYPKLVRQLARTWLLVLDDWGLASLSGRGRHDLLEVLDDRYARRGTILGSQLPVEHWHDAPSRHGE